MDARRHIALIGAGQLGRRHLQALVKLPDSACLTVIDPAPAALAACRAAVREVAGCERHAYDYRLEIGALPPVDFAVVATTADVRRATVERLLAATAVKNLLLEKVLFQRASDCTAIGALLQDRGVKAWVNAARRTWPFYRKLKHELQNDRVLHLRMEGSGWGLACNAYHFLDLFVYLGGGGLARLSPDGLDHRVIESKRAGYKELSGILAGTLDNGALISIRDAAGEKLPLAVLVETDRRMLRIDEKAKTLALLAGEPLGESLVPEPMLQSNSTHRLIQEILTSGSCDLPAYEEAASLHRQMLKCFAVVFSPGTDSETALCPIT
jgi:hypothetical protein